MLVRPKVVVRCFERVPAKRSFFVFAHGTSPECASLIRVSGLNEEQAKLHQRGSPYPGSFHVFELGPPDAPGPGLQAAYEFGARQVESPVILIGQLPGAVFEAMLERAYAIAERILYSEPDVPDQVVFFPAAFEEFNRHVRWLKARQPGQR